jgi:hypothetical protein
LLGESDENHQFGLAGVPNEIRNEHLPNTTVDSKAAPVCLATYSWFIRLEIDV